MEVLSEHNCEGWLEGYLLTGRHGLFATYEAFAMVVASMTIQHAKWLEECAALPWRAPVPSLNVLLTSTVLAQRPQRLQPPGARPHGHDHRRRGRWRGSTCRRTRTACSSVATTACAAANYVNLIVIDKQPQLQWLDPRRGARALRARGVDLGWAGNETSARGSRTSCWPARATCRRSRRSRPRPWLREHAPELRVRVVNVVDLMTLCPPGRAPARHEDRYVRSSCSPTIAT
jgi:xylulose-5-phosphate/fructose-6-phosphate phosphoketolase